MSQTKLQRAAWQKKLYRKTYVMCAWDWSGPAKPYIRALCAPFGIRPSFTSLDGDYPEQLLVGIARKHRLHLYEVPSLIGSDQFGLVLSKQELDTRELQQIEADYWGEDFDEGDGGYVARVRPAKEVRTRASRRPPRRSRDGWIAPIRRAPRDWTRCVTTYRGSSHCFEQSRAVTSACMMNTVNSMCGSNRTGITSSRKRLCAKRCCYGPSTARWHSSAGSRETIRPTTSARGHARWMTNPSPSQWIRFRRCSGSAFPLT